MGRDVLDAGRTAAALRQAGARRRHHFREHTERIRVGQSPQHRNAITIGHARSSTAGTGSHRKLTPAGSETSAKPYAPLVLGASRAEAVERERQTVSRLGPDLGESAVRGSVDDVIDQLGAIQTAGVDRVVLGHPGTAT